MKFGEKLRKYRNEKGLTQAELAKQAGLGINTISNYESGKTYPQNRAVYKILAEFSELTLTIYIMKPMTSSSPHRANMAIEGKNRLCSL